MADPLDPPRARPDGLPHPPLRQPLQVPLGRTLPQLVRVPTLGAQPPLAAPLVPHHSHLAHGVAFTGIARLSGSLTVAGEWNGQVLSALPAPDAATAASTSHVTITESGQLLGQIEADDIAVLGRASGLLDAGRITLHESAQVRGHLRYGQLQVNGAEVDARLECTRTGPAESPHPAQC